MLTKLADNFTCHNILVRSFSSSGVCSYYKVEDKTFCYKVLLNIESLYVQYVYKRYANSYVCV